MNKRITLTALTLTLGMGFLPAATQDAPPPANAPQHQEMGPALHLSEAQKTSFQAIRAKHEPSLAARRKALEAAHAAFKEAEKAPDTKPETLKALHRTLADLAFDLRLERRAMKQEIRAILSPEQREESARMEGRMEGMRRSHRGEREGQEDGHATPQAPCCPTPAR